MSDNNTENQRRSKPKIGISTGDLNGIGIEVVIKTFEDERMFDHCVPILYGSSKALSYHRNVYKKEEFKYNIINNPDKSKEGVLNVLNCWEEQTNISLGIPDDTQGIYSFKALEQVAQDIKKGMIDAIITAPVNKKHISLVKPGFSGQTEFFAEAFGVEESLMMLVSNSMRMGLVTNHLPINKIVEAINPELIVKKIKLMNRALIRDFMIDRPKIAVLALNPHAGDEGVIGSEDDDLIRPVIKVTNENENILVYGPYAADGFFGSGTYRQFDGILAMYHDQGLIPFKTLSFGQGVNFTAGLPYVRTSPDHGTAYDIAGKMLADHDSFRKAVFDAIDIINNRAKFDEMNANPLDKMSKKLRQQGFITDEDESAEEVTEEKP